MVLSHSNQSLSIVSCTKYHQLFPYPHANPLVIKTPKSLEQAAQIKKRYHWHQGSFSSARAISSGLFRKLGWKSPSFQAISTAKGIRADW